MSSFVKFLSDLSFILSFFLLLYKQFFVSVSQYFSTYFVNIFSSLIYHFTFLVVPCDDRNSKIEYSPSILSKIISAFTVLL